VAPETSLFSIISNFDTGKNSHTKMKHFVILLVFASLSTVTNAQMGYLNLGYSGNGTSLKGLNEVVKNYNSSRTWLDKEMKEFGHLNGLVVGTGGGAANFWFDFEMSLTSQKRHASGTEPAGKVATRYLKYKNNNFAISLGGAGGEDGATVAGGIRFDFGKEKLKTKVDYKNQTNEGWSMVGDGLLSTRVGPTFKFIVSSYGGAMFSITTYYTWSVFLHNVTEFDEIINNTNYQDLEQEKFNIRSNVFGFTVTTGILGSD